VPDACIQVIQRPADAPRFDLAMITNPPEPAPVGVPWPDHQWVISIVDEGAPEPDLAHGKYVMKALLDEAKLARLVEQPSPRLTLAKLRQLLQRAAGREWLCEQHRHLDVAEAEVADVRLGLEAWLRLPGARERLEEMAGQLDAPERDQLESLVAWRSNR
jgi:hypothetical protein